MMCQHFGKLKFLESTLELLQQFKLQMISSSDEFTIFPGDCSKFSLMCTRCGKCISYPESIGWTLFNAPYTIFSHLDIVLLDEDENDPSNQLETLPILFTSHSNYDESFAFFLDSLKTGGDSDQTNDIDFKIKGDCIVQQNRAGEFLFCEAVKVDASLSDVELKKNVRNTISLLKVLFEDLGEAMTWHEKVTENSSVSELFDGNTLFFFNNTNESGDLDESLFGQHILDKFRGWK